jgi:hypothetical protein
MLAHQAVRNAFLCLVPLSFLLLRFDLKRFGPGTRMTVIALGVGLLAASFEDHVIEGYGSSSDALALIQYDVAPATFPEELAAFMREAGIQGGIMNDGRWGGYLTWRLWPNCHVFVDSRHHLTEEMWPVFMASQNPDQRDAALEYAFKRWGIELTACRGPTFAAILPSSTQWQLLYKAGDQELYQHRRGRHATLNLNRTWRWLGAQRSYKAFERPLDLERLDREARDIGASRWLGAPFQRYRAQKARMLVSSPDRERKCLGLALQSTLQFDAGKYQEALATLQQILKQRPDDSTALYRTLLASLAIGDTSRALSTVDRIKSHPADLTVHQLRRVAAIYGMLSARR